MTRTASFELFWREYYPQASNKLPLVHGKLLLLQFFQHSAAIQGGKIWPEDMPERLP